MKDQRYQAQHVRQNMHELKLPAFFLKLLLSRTRAIHAMLATVPIATLHGQAPPATTALQTSHVISSVWTQCFWRLKQTVVDVDTLRSSKIRPYDLGDKTVVGPAGLTRRLRVTTCSKLTSRLRAKGCSSKALSIKCLLPFEDVYPDEHTQLLEHCPH